MMLEEIPQQNLDGVHATIVKCLDEVVSCQLSLTAWDMFTFPEEDEEHWLEDCLSYFPGKVVNISTRMPGIQLFIQDTKGQYNGNACVLLYEGQMLAYDPASNLLEWVPMWGLSSSLKSTELKSAYDLSNILLCPHPKAIPPSSQSARISTGSQSVRPICCLLVGKEIDLDTMGTDSEEWDPQEHADWSCCPTPLLEGTLILDEVTSEPTQRQNQCLILCNSQESEEWESDDATKAQQGEYSECSKDENTQNLPNDECPLA